ncbi:MAG: nicotinate (nicotinamide) nucleotide adenylyltransferase [Clostridia bacterium]|nr:nicotinate (nicotinamide) nucleotide adenylyltransferase [Clostridia bacterium]
MGFTALFGGTFNPFHNGHYEMLKALQNDSNIDEIWLMPDRIPPHKDYDYLPSDDDRISMCELVAKDFPKASVCLVEFEREGKSYSYDTVVELKEKHKDKNFIFVCGGDMFVYFPKWYRYLDLMKLIPFYVFSRVGTSVEEFDACVKEFKAFGMKILLNNTEIPNISSTQFRTTKDSSLLPETIYGYISERGLYSV